MFSARLLKNASRQLRKLDAPTTRRIIAQIQWLADHFEEITPEPLKGELAGLFKCRQGDYRIICEPLRQEKLIIVHEIGHRSEIYRKAKT